MRRDAELADRDFIEPKDLINKPIMISRQALAADLPKWMGDDISRVNVVVWRRGQQFTKAGSVFLEEMKRVIEEA